MTVDEAVAAVERTLAAEHLRVDRKLVRQDETAYLLLVLDVRRELDDTGPVRNGPRLVAKDTGEVTRMTVPEALARAERMSIVRD